MSVPALGHNSSLLIAMESTYATAPGTATSKYDIANFRFSINQSSIECPNMNSLGASPTSIVPGLQFVTGSFDLQWGFEGCEELTRFLLPTYSSAVNDTSARDHTYKEGVNLKSYTFDVSFGNIPTSKVTRFTGCYCTGWSFQVEAGIIIMSITFAAAAVLENTTPMTGSLTNLNRLAISNHGHLLLTTGNIKDGSGLDAAIRLRRLAVKVEYPHDTQRQYGGTGSWADSPVRNGSMKTSIEGQIQWDAASYVMMAKLTGNAPAAGGLKFLWQHPTIIGAVSAKREFEIICTSPTAGGYDAEIPGPGVILQNFTWIPEFNDADASCIKVRNRSTTAALV